MTYTERLPRHKSETEHDPPAAQRQKARTIETHKYLASDADQSDHMYVVEYAKQAMPTYTDRFSKRGFPKIQAQNLQYESFATVGEIRIWWRADFQSGSRVLKKVF